MKYLLSISVTLVLGIALTLYHLFGTEPVLSSMNTVFIIDAKGLAAIGCFVALYQFSARDYLRRAWGVLAIGAIFLVEAEVVVAVFTPVLSPETVAYMRGGLAVVANIASPLAMVMFARALSVAGLDIAGSARGRAVVYVVAALIALVVSGYSTVGNIEAVIHGNVTAITDVASGLGDIVALMLIAPLIYNVATLRGGTLLWPFAFLTASRLAWLIYDGIVVWGGITHEVELTGALRHGLRLMALLFLFWAGLAQRWALAHTPQKKAATAGVAATAA